MGMVRLKLAKTNPQMRSNSQPEVKVRLPNPYCGCHQKHKYGTRLYRDHTVLRGSAISGQHRSTG